MNRHDWPLEWGNYFKIRWFQSDNEDVASVYMFRGDHIFFADWIWIGEPL